MTFDLTFSITAIIALSAIISPSITAWINNKHALKITELNFKEKELTEFNLHKRMLIENFMTSVGRTIKSNQTQNRTSLTNAFYALLPYLPKEEIDLFSTFYEDVLTCSANDSLEKEIILAVKKMLKE